MLKHGILGLLSYSDMTGYEIMEVFRDSLSYFWTAQTSQIYRELQTLKSRGYVTDTPVKGKGGNKKVFSITDEGREELKQWLRQGSGIDMNSSLLMMTFFRGELPPQENMEWFAGLKHMMEMMGGGLTAADSSILRYSDMIDGRYKALYWQMTVEYGRMMAEMLVKWSDKCMDMIREAEGQYEDTSDKRQPQG